MPIDFYYFALSPPCRVVHTVAKELGVDLNIINVDLTNEEQKKPEFTKLNPLQKVPVINDNGYILWESHVIITYLCNKYGSPSKEHLYPKDAKKRAQVDKLLFFSMNTLFAGVGAYVRPKLGFSKEDPKIGETQLQTALAILEDILEKTPFLTGENYTIADICCLIYITTLEALKLDFRPYPHLQKWARILKSSIAKFSECNAKALQLSQDYLKKVSSKP